MFGNEPIFGVHRRPREEVKKSAYNPTARVDLQNGQIMVYLVLQPPLSPTDSITPSGRFPGCPEALNTD